jgi:hypothetical protein
MTYSPGDLKKAMKVVRSEIKKNNSSNHVISYANKIEADTNFLFARNRVIDANMKALIRVSAKYNTKITDPLIDLVLERSQNNSDITNHIDILTKILF